MTGIRQNALVSIYLRNDAQIDGAELASLVRHAGSRRPDAAISATVSEFANPLDRQVVRIVRGEIPGAEALFTPSDLTRLRRRVDLANDDGYVRQMAGVVARATHAPERPGNNVEMLID